MICGRGVSFLLECRLALIDWLIDVLCFSSGYSSYRLVDAHDTPNGFSGLIQRKTDSFNVYPSPIELLQLKITFDTNDRLRIQIFDSQKARFQVPFPILPEPPATHPDHLNYVLRVQQDPFSLQVARKNGGEVLFDTSAGGFSFYDQFIEISSFLPSNYIYGLGEHSDRLSHPLDYTRSVVLFGTCFSRFGLIRSFVRLINWRTDCSTDRLIDRSVDWLVVDIWLIESSG